VLADEVRSAEAKNPADGAGSVGLTAIFDEARDTD